MESKELHTILVGDSNDGVMMTEYGGKIGLFRYNESSGGKNFLRMCYPKTRNGASDKQLPMGVDLGGKAAAISALEQFLLVLKAQK